MTILNLMLGRGRGGIEQAALDYAEALLHAGLPHVTVIQPDAAMQGPIETAHIPHLLLKNRAEWDPLCTLRLRRLIAREHASAIIAHGNRAIGLALRASNGRIPVIAVAHNYKVKRFPRADAVFAITQDLQQFLIHSGVAPGRIHLMPNIVRLPEVPPRAAFHTPPVIGGMGRFVEKKGFEVLIDAVGLLLARGIRVRCLIGGDGELRPELQAKIDRLQLGTSITLTGWVEDKNHFFDGLDLFILPSHHEPFGIVLIEAMARGVPVISTMSEGPREIIEQGIQEMEDYYLAADVLARVRDGKEQVHSGADVRRDLGLDS